MNEIYLQAIGGGLLIGLSATLMLWLHGRIAGISGILYGILDTPKGDTAWRVLFIASLLAGGFAMFQLMPASASVVPRENFPNLLLVIAGLLVGLGTRIGGGCTSGHGVCGIARLSKRSITATLVFMASGMATVFIARHIAGII